MFSWLKLTEKESIRFYSFLFCFIQTSPHLTLYIYPTILLTFFHFQDNTVQNNIFY